MEQRSAEWHAARLGKVTASRIADVVAKTKTGYGASRANYRAQLVVERLTGVAAESYTNAAMQHGTDTEPQARAAYEWLSDRSVIEVGFIEHPTIAMSGCSPDGLVGADGLVEIKCPSTATHIETLLSETIPDKYVKQMQWQMACAGRQWCDFVSFDPRVPDKMRTFIKRVPRDDALLDELSLEVHLFLAEVDDTLSRLQAKFSLERAA
jgi:putative phage-type endonuclease